MKVLLLGSGGREHALAWKIAQSPKVEKLYIAPGNAGTSEAGENVNLKATDFPALKAFALEKEIDMIVVGPEDPLVQGIFDSFKEDPATCHIDIIGPTAKGATLEGSKEFAKGFMMRHNIPTARYNHRRQLAGGTRLPRFPRSALRTEGRRTVCRQGRADSPHTGRSSERAEGNAGRHVRRCQRHGSH